MNYKKLILVGCISAFVAVLTSILGVAGTVIGSVISSVLYNMLSEALENPVSNATLNHEFEWEIAYVFPLVVIAIIQLLLIFALLAEMGILPYGFINFFLSLQHLANNNLYRILGFALIIISAYPLVLKPDYVKKEHGFILIFVGLIFLARGFVDLGNGITMIYDGLFRYFDLPIAIIAFLLISVVILRILKLSYDSKNEAKAIQHNSGDNVIYRHSPKNFQNRPDDNDYGQYRRKTTRQHYPKKIKRPVIEKSQSANVKFKDNIQKRRPVSNKRSSTNINESSDKIQFESNDLLDDYK